MSGEQAAEPSGGPLVCELVRRGKFLVGEPFFTPGLPVTLGRRGSVAAAEGELAALQAPARGRARVLEVLGRPDDVRAVLHGLALESGAARPWPRAVEQELAELAAPGGGDARSDLRDVLTFTIDPPDARDFDDAISLLEQGGRRRVLVHIADVAAFVAPDGAIDREASRRATSVYLPGRVEPMLPLRLSAGLCSLQPGQERLAVTVELDADDPLAPAAVYRSRIRSDHRLSYPQAQRLLAGEERCAPPLLEALRATERLALDLRERRFRRGALRVESAEVEFSFDQRGVSSARLAPEPHAHVLVEELMILVNEQVAALLSGARRPALFRVHEPPEPESIETLVARLAALEVPTPPLPELHTPRDAARYAAVLSGSVTRYARGARRPVHVLSGLVLRALKLARYDPRNLGHAGLASSAYCHFTSPIRRYPDLIVHRALLAHLGLDGGVDEEALPELALHSSEREREAAALERRGDDICLAFLLERTLFHRGWQEPFAGVVAGIVEGGLFARFGEVFEGFLPARLLGEERWDADELGVALVGRTSGRRLRLADPVSVVVRSLERPRGRVLLEREGLEGGAAGKARHGGRGSGRMR